MKRGLEARRGRPNEFDGSFNEKADDRQQQQQSKNTF
jgi:hypothetical protein